jgi:hypothetical protein
MCFAKRASRVLFLRKSFFYHRLQNKQNISFIMDSSDSDDHREQEMEFEDFLKKKQEDDQNISNFIKDVFSGDQQASGSSQFEHVQVPTEMDIDDHHGHNLDIEDDNENMDHVSMSDYFQSDADDVQAINPFDDIAETDLRKSQMSEEEGTLLLLLHQSRFNTPNVASEFLTKLINDMLHGQMVPLFSTHDWDTMISKLPNGFQPKIRKYFYSLCGNLIGPVFNLKEQATCSYGHPTCVIVPQDALKIDSNCSYFCYIPIKEWLTHQIPLIFDKLRIYRQDQGSERKFYHDLPNGEHYDRLVKMRTGCATLTLTLTWDGVSFSNNKSIWPVVAYLNETPFQFRINNPMLVAIQASKPTNLMLRPLVDELVQLDTEPLCVVINGVEKQFFVRVLLFIADSPARSMLLNCVQHNGYFGTT